jgi:hypothetical protein
VWLVCIKMRCRGRAAHAVALPPLFARASASTDAARSAAVGGARRPTLRAHAAVLCTAPPSARVHAAGRRVIAGWARRASAAASADSAALDADMLAALNDLSSRAVRAMLSGKADNVDGLRTEVASTVDVLRQHAGGDTDDAALQFLRLLDELLQHRVPPAVEGEQLSGAYARAFSAIITAVEGEWRLSVPGQPDGPPQEPTFAMWEVRL